MDLADKMHFVCSWLMFVRAIIGTVVCLIANS